MHVSEFYIDRKAMGAFWDFLNDCQGEASNIQTYGVPTIPAGGGALFPKFTKWHDEMKTRAEERMESVEKALQGAANSVSGALDFYNQTEDANAAKLDATYPGESTKSGLPSQQYQGPNASNDPPDVNDAYHEFRSSHPSEPLQRTELDTKELEPKVSGIEENLTQLANVLSPYWLITNAIEFILDQVGLDSATVGADTIFASFTGNWREWAQATARWQLVGKAYEGLANDLGKSERLELFWRGNASDAAQRYFKKLQSAVSAETPYYNDYLVPAYKEVIHVTYDALTVVNNCVQFVVDLALTAGISAVVQTPKLVEAILNAINVISAVITDYRAFDTRGPMTHWAASRKEPPCEIQRLRLDEKSYSLPSHGSGHVAGQTS